MDTLRKFRIEQNALRIYVFSVGIGMTVYCGLLCFGVRNLIAELLCIIGAYILLLGGAWMFKLCWLSWAFIFYSFLVRLCILLYAEGFFEGTWHGYSVLEMAHHTVFTVGAVLTSVFLCNIKKFYRIMFGKEISNV